MDLLNLLQNRDMLTNIFIMFIGISLVQYFDTKILISITALILMIVNLPRIQELTSTETTIKRDIKKKEIGEDMYYNSKIQDLLIELKQFKRYNKVSYKEGVKHMRQFFKTIKILEHDNLYNRNQYYELADNYLKQAINHFQSISVSMPERDLKDAIKLGDFEATKKTVQLATIVKELYNQCYYILLNIGITFNKEWLEHPNIYTKEIDLNTERVESYNKNDEVNWTMY